MASALASDDECEWQDCSLELHQLRGMKVNYLETLEDGLTGRGGGSRADGGGS